MMGNYERTDPSLAQTECVFLSTLKQNRSNGRYRFFIRRLIFTEKNAYNSGEKSRAEAKKGNRKRARDKWRERLFAVYTILNTMKRKYSFPIRIIYNIFGVRGHEEKHDRRLVDTFSSSKSLLFDFCWLYAVFFFLLLCATKDMCDLFW